MLEFNTDRSFWMVGAIIVGAVLVILAKTVFKNVLESITNWFTKLIGQTTGNGGLSGNGAIVSALPGIDAHALAAAVSHVLPSVIH